MHLSDGIGAAFGAGGTILSSMLGMITVTGLAEAAIYAAIGGAVGWLVTKVLERVFGRKKNDTKN